MHEGGTILGAWARPGSLLGVAQEGGGWPRPPKRCFPGADVGCPVLMCGSPLLICYHPAPCRCVWVRAPAAGSPLLRKLWILGRSRRGETHEITSIFIKGKIP